MAAAAAPRRKQQRRISTSVDGLLKVCASGRVEVAKSLSAADPRRKRQRRMLTAEQSKKLSTSVDGLLKVCASGRIEVAKSLYAYIKKQEWCDLSVLKSQFEEDRFLDTMGALCDQGHVDTLQWIVHKVLSTEFPVHDARELLVRAAEKGRPKVVSWLTDEFEMNSCDRIRERGTFGGRGGGGRGWECMRW